MKNAFRKFVVMAAAALTMISCTRIETGEVGLRVDASKQVQSTELLPGSWNQTIVGDVLTFPVRDVAVNIDNKQPLTADNSALADFDVTVIYSINPAAVSDLWSKKSRAFHEFDEKAHDWILMHKFMDTLVNNASYKAVRGYKALEAADNRKQIEEKVRDNIVEVLKDEKLAEAITITGVQVRSIVPSADIIRSANEAVKAQNDLKTKTIEVQTAKMEAERVAALSQNANSVAYMNAKAVSDIAEGIKAGKVNTIVVPFDFHGMVNIK